MLSHLASVSIFGVASGDFENGSPSPTKIFSTFPVSSYRHPLRLHFYFIFICTPDFGAPSLFRASVPPSGCIAVKGCVREGGGGVGATGYQLRTLPLAFPPHPAAGGQTVCTVHMCGWMGTDVAVPTSPIGSLPPSSCRSNCCVAKS